MRIQEAALWFALLNLGSLRSPFVPDAYAWFGSIWLATLVWAGLRRRTVVATVLVSALMLGFTRVFDGLLPEGGATPPWVLAVTLLIQASALSFNAWVVWQASRPVRPQPVGVVAGPSLAAQ